MEQRIPGWTAIGQSVNCKADAEHATIESRRSVHCKDFDLADRVIARAVPSRGYTADDQYFNPLAPVDLTAAGVLELRVLGTIKILVIRAEPVPGHRDADRPGVDLKPVRRTAAQGRENVQAICQA